MRHFIAFLFLISFAAFSATAKAELKLAVVDVPRLMTESKASEHIQSQLEKSREKFMKEISEKEKALRDKEKSIVEKRAEMSKEELAKQSKEFETQLIETRKLAQQRKKTLDEASAKAIGTLQNEIVKIVQSIADANDYALVISSQNIVIGEKSLDITPQVMDALNKNMPKVSVDIK